TQNCAVVVHRRYLSPLAWFVRMWPHSDTPPHLQRDRGDGRDACRSARARPFLEAIAIVSIVIDSVYLFQFADMGQRPVVVWTGHCTSTHRLETVEQCLLKAFAQAQPLVIG